MFCHVFGAYFGLMVSFVLGRNRTKNCSRRDVPHSELENNKNNRNDSEISATIGISAQLL